MIGKEEGWNWKVEERRRYGVREEERKLRNGIGGWKMERRGIERGDAGGREKGFGCSVRDPKRSWIPPAGVSLKHICHRKAHRGPL